MLFLNSDHSGFRGVGVLFADLEVWFAVTREEALSKRGFGAALVDLGDFDGDLGCPATQDGSTEASEPARVWLPAERVDADSEE